MTRRFLTPLSTNHIDFNLTHPSTYGEGRLYWDGEEGTLNLGMSDSVQQSVGMEFYMPPVKNNSGVDIPNGSFVMATGAQGDRITIAKAVADGSIASEYMIGIATMDIPNGAENGLITVNGTVRDIDTSDWPIGTILYPSSASAGALTASVGQAPAIKTPVAIVLRQHANTGRIYVRMDIGKHLSNDLNDVQVTSPQDGDTLSYNSSSGIWENSQPEQAPVSSGSAYPTENLTNGQLFYNTSNGRTAIYFESFWKEFAYYTDTVQTLDGGTYNTTVFDNSVDGGTPSDAVFVGSYDGGTI